MSSVTLMWVGDLNQDRKMQGLSTKVSDENCINKRMISRNHATIERLLNGGFMLYDHSMNGTYINYMRVSGGVTLKHGDIVCFGHLNGANLKPGEDVAPFFSDLKYQVRWLFLAMSQCPIPIGFPFCCVLSVYFPCACTLLFEGLLAMVQDWSFSTLSAHRPNDPAGPDSAAPVGKRQRQSSQSGSLSSPKRADTASPETKISRSSAKKTTNSHKSRRLGAKAEDDDDEEAAGDKSNGSSRSSSEDDLLTAASKRKLPVSSLTSSSTKPKKSNGERQSTTATKRHSVAASPPPPPSSHSKKSSSSLSKSSTGHQHHGTKERKSGRSTGTSSSSAAKRVKTETEAELDSGGELYHYDTEECSARPCKHPQDVAIDWIQCDKCSNWYHQVCLGLRASEANVDVYYCPYCKKN
ncbi:unnamed protein product [Dibothriocephalus latus]|uniref:FHA domain-containing protein n=1 Tax=Dibothriocephalus latus TaxID=60516 RepID=A0A3P7P4D5_DIBLA|nr:unnamed protein product [Dibothriocephalus latus]